MIMDYDDYEMESGDYEMESGEDDLYSDDHDDKDEPTHGFIEEAVDDSTMISLHRSEKNYVVLKEKDIRKQQKDDIGQVSMVLSITEVEASRLLLHYHWSVGKVHDDWFADEERVRRTVGILEGGHVVVPKRKSRKVQCGICFDSFRSNKIVPIACGHSFCPTCWAGYITTAINDGPGCLMLKCPQPSCPVAVGRDMIEKLASEEDKDKYDRFFLRSYIEENRKMKWCPAPGCEHAIDFSSTGTGRSYDVSCLCSHSFCWNCTEDAYRSVDCDTVAQWTRKNSSEAENTKWILANSKACPKCKRPIEKNHGCMHMTCSPPCKYGFCWLCLGAWKDHGEQTGGFYACNRYEKARKEGLHNKAEKKREMAKNALERYTHYYERWASNQTSRQKAIGDLHKFLSEKIMKLSGRQCIPETQLAFITDAWLQIIECRRVLKWTYAYGYYLPESVHDKRQLFEYLQGEAESGLERLHKCVELESEVFHTVEEPLESEVFQIAEEPSDQNFKNFKTKLISLTSVTKTYFENLVKTLENGFSDVDSQTDYKKRKAAF